MNSNIINLDTRLPCIPADSEELDYLFHNNGDEQLYCASADPMERNMFNRVEVAFPILDEGFRKRIISELQLYLSDNTQAWTLNADGNYTRETETETPVTARDMLLESLAES